MFTKQIIDSIEKRKNKCLGLPHFQSYMNSIGNPQNKLDCIHIAGTNGKGSTLNYLRSILQEAGYRVGTFTSPYLETHLDRIRVNDQNIDEASFEGIANTYYASWLNADLNMFEIDMVLACFYFIQEKCDICIFEVGLGGRLDATNILQPWISAITNIGMDHMDRLGDTYEKIAKEKAGIVKPNVPLISSEKRIVCQNVFNSICSTKKAPLIYTEVAHNIKQSMYEITFDYQSYNSIVLPCGALYQVENAVLAIEIANYLKERRLVSFTTNNVLNGLKNTVWKGRFEVMHEHPLILIDGAHNTEGIKALKESLRMFPHVKILFAALKDKDTQTMIEQLLTISDEVIVTELDFYRAKKASELAKHLPVRVEEDFYKVIKEAMSDPITPLIITGSLYFITEVRAYLTKLNKGH